MQGWPYVKLRVEYSLLNEIKGDFIPRRFYKYLLLIADFNQAKAITLQSRMLQWKWWTAEVPSVVFEVVWECKRADIYNGLSVNLRLVLTAVYVTYYYFSPFKGVNTYVKHISAQILSKLSRLTKLSAKLIMANLDFNQTSWKITLQFRPKKPYQQFKCRMITSLTRVKLEKCNSQKMFRRNLLFTRKALKN